MLKTIKAAVTPVGLQVMTLNNSTAVVINSTCRPAQVLSLSIEGTGARYRADAAPTNTTGVYLDTNTHWTFDGYNYYDGTSNLRFCRAGASGTSTVTVQAWRYRNSPSA